MSTTQSPNAVRITDFLPAAPTATTSGERAAAAFTVVTREHYRDSAGQEQTRSTSHPVVVTGQSAAFALQYLKPGSEVVVSGRLWYQDGQPRLTWYRVEAQRRTSEQDAASTEPSSDTAAESNPVAASEPSPEPVAKPKARRRRKPATSPQD